MIWIVLPYGIAVDHAYYGLCKIYLTGKYEPLGSERRSTQTILDGGEVIGTTVRTRTGVSTVYVSTEHNIDLQTAVKWVLNCEEGY